MSYSESDHEVRAAIQQTLYVHNAGLMLGHCLRHWPNIRPTLVHRVVFPAESLLYKQETTSA